MGAVVLIVLAMLVVRGMTTNRAASPSTHPTATLIAPSKTNPRPAQTDAPTTMPAQYYFAVFTLTGKNVGVYHVSGPVSVIKSTAPSPSPTAVLDLRAFKLTTVAGTQVSIEPGLYRYVVAPELPPLVGQYKLTP